MSLHMLGAHAYPEHAPDAYVRRMGGRTGSGSMFRSRLHSISDMAEAMSAMVAEEDELPAWCTDVIAEAYTQMFLVYGYVEPIAARGG